ncbi:hypothetical protein H5T88_09940 [bacterium]|nr:hypothetical protein [bacterium]
MHSFSMIKYEIATPSAEQKARNDNGALILLRKELSLKPIPIDASPPEAGVAISIFREKTSHREAFHRNNIKARLLTPIPKSDLTPL